MFWCYIHVYGRLECSTKIPTCFFLYNPAKYTMTFFNSCLTVYANALFNPIPKVSVNPVYTRVLALCACQVEPQSVENPHVNPV